MSPPLALRWRPFRFALPRAMVTAHGAVRQRAGWLLRLEAPDGRLGWGEAAPLEPVQGAGDLPEPEPFRLCRAAIAALGDRRGLPELEAALPDLPRPLAFALGGALAELQGLVGEAAGGWRPAPAAAWLLPAGEAALEALEAALAAAQARPAAAAAPQLPFTVKWKVAAAGDPLERRLLDTLLQRLPAGARLRLDANGGWDRATAFAWAERLAGEARLDWLEQPLPAADLEGLRLLAARLPVALDESLRADPALAVSWPGWLVRRPALEGDPRPLLAQLQAGLPRCMVSTALETGIARRWLRHLAALQAEGPTPAAPGLAPGWVPQGPLFGEDPGAIWDSLAEAPR